MLSSVPVRLGPLCTVGGSMSAGHTYGAGVNCDGESALPATDDSSHHHGRQLTEHLPNIRNYIASRVHNHQDVDDLLHDTLVRSLTATASKPVDNLLAYSLTVARTVVFDYWNRNRRQPEGSEALPDMPSVPLDEVQIQVQKLERLQQILQDMPPLMRQVFMLRRLHGQSREEIAQTLDMNPEAVKKHITRATLRIAEAMEKSGY